MRKDIITIAEIGVNHLGSMDKALRMVKKAAEAGATAVKFQKYNPVKVLGKDSPYLKDAHQLSWKELTDLSIYARRLGLKFGCSVFCVEDIAIVAPISDYMKIATRMNKNQEFIARVAQTKLQTFMSIQPDTQLQGHYRDRFNLMWCIPQYPSLKEDVLQYPYKYIGLSSHCPDWTASLEAYKLGARVFEHHIKESNHDVGCDMASSLTFDDYQLLLASLDAERCKVCH